MSQTKKPSFEKQMERLQEVVAALEKSDLPLEKSVALYKEGLGLAAACRKQLEKARLDVKVYSEGSLADFEPEEEEAP